MALQHWPRAEKVLGQCCPGCKRITFQSWANTFGYIYGCWPNTVNSVSEIMALHWPIHFMLSGPTYPCSLLFRLKILYIRIKRKKNQKLFIIIFDFLFFLNKLKNLRKRIYILCGSRAGPHERSGWLKGRWKQTRQILFVTWIYIGSITGRQCSVSESRPRDNRRLELCLYENRKVKIILQWVN